MLIYIEIYTYMGVYDGNEFDNIEKNEKKKVIQREESNAKESRCYDVFVLMNHHQV